MRDLQSTKQVTMYGYATSPFVWEVNCYLNYKQIDFSFVDVNPLTSEEVRFTGQGQVPVLLIGDEWKINSLEIARWLDEKVPGRPLFTRRACSQRVLQANEWVTARLRPSLFRQIVDWDRWIDGVRNGWTLAQIVHHGTPLPPHVRAWWPFGLRRTDFIVAYANSADRTQSLSAMGEDLTSELLMHLGCGPFLGESPMPTIADLSAFPIVAAPYLLGFRGESLVERDDQVRAWATRVADHLPTNPLPCADHFINRTL